MIEGENTFMAKFKKILIVASLLMSSLGMGFLSLNQVEAQESGFEDPEFIELLDKIIEAETLYGLSGVQLAVYKDGVLVKNHAYGYTNNYYNIYDESGNIILDTAKALPLDERHVVTNDTLFDMASNTKMYATVFAMQKLVSEGKITLDTLVKDIFEEFTDYGNEKGWKDVITVKHVLSHYAGFAPDPQYHNDTYDLDDGIPNGKNDLFSQDKALTFEMVMKTPVTTQPGTSWAYSDVDMMLAGFIIEEITGKDLDTYVKESFYTPLALDRITFNPLRFGFDPSETSSAEIHGNTRDGRINFINVRQSVVTGQVHDEKAFYAMDGVSGHAGLFGTAQQVAYLAQAMLDGTLNGITLFDQDTIDEFTNPANLLTQTNGGWRRKSETGGAATWFSKFSSVGTIGHTGWTGTLTFIDPTHNLTVALFTNRTNAPILGVNPNTFYTTNSNISSYGAVAEFIYRGLGLGDGLSVNDVFFNMINVEIPANLSNVTAAKRNVVRSLLHVLEERALTDAESKTFLESSKIQTTIAALESTFASDTKFLVVTKKLDTLIETATQIDAIQYTNSSIDRLQAVIEESEELLGGSYIQDEVDAQVVLLQEAIDSLVYKTNTTNLEKLIEDVKDVDEGDYTAETYEKFEIAFKNAVELLENDPSQEAVDAAYLALEQAYEDLELLEKEEPVDPVDPSDPKGELPTTGMNNNTLIYGSISLILAGLILTLYASKKRKWFN